jgi:hypothetical protein
MVLAGLAKKPKMNGKVVRVKKAVVMDGRWLVTEANQDNELSIATQNLRHIRPAI